jgi:transglutaminase-like putative cysteine protease
MPRVRIVHTTSYFYVKPVRFTTHRLMLRPRDSHDLRLLDATLGISPPGASMRWAHDVFANSVCMVDWEEAVADRLDIISSLDLQHYPAMRRLAGEGLDPVAEYYPFGYAADEFPDLARLMERHHPDPERTVDAWAHGFLKKGEPTRTMDLLVGMTQAIKADFTYVGREAEGTNLPTVTLATRTGACRDFALLMMEALRSLGLAARFVSGYVYDEDLVDSAEPTVGGGATHAWCSVYLPGAGWIEFDPTNGLIAGRNLIRVCVARAPEQAVPIAGGFIGARSDYTRMAIDVGVTVGDDREPQETAETAETEETEEVVPPVADRAKPSMALAEVA